MNKKFNFPKYQKKLISLLLIFLILSNINKAAFAQVIDSIHYSWQVVEYEEEIATELEAVKRCYVLAKPESSKTNYTAKRDAYVSVTRYENDRTEEVNISAGYEYKLSSKVNVLVGDKDYLFFTRGSSAWLDHALKDKDFIEEMLKSDVVKVRSDSSIGSYAVDEYSLKGFARAYKRMKELCE